MVRQSWIYILAAFVIPAAIICSLAVLSYLLVKYFKQQRKMKRYAEFLLLIRIRKLYKEILCESLDPYKLRPRAAKKRRVTVAKSLRRKSIRTPKNIVLNEKISIVPEDLRIKFDQLDMGRVLGQGAFGRVYQAVLKDPQDGSQRTVAVKTIQDTSEPRNIIKFLEEGLLMKIFDHPNVLGLLGLTFDPEDQPLIVLPFMANGDLKSFLLNPKQEITNAHLTQFAYHVALGMEYLGQHDFVHRDLAARNCMIDDQLVAKIADFGLSRDLDESDYYTSGDKQAKMPIKWMAPESMERMVYSTMTDVWSYGVLLWELFSRGKRPYPGLHNSDVYIYLKQGLRMDPPKFCLSKISAIMRDCWQDRVPQDAVLF